MLPLRVAFLFSLISVAVSVLDAQNTLRVASPNGQIVFVLSPASGGQAALTYSVDLP